jgi:hypothetical protein
MVSSVVAGSLNEIITYLGKRDLENAQRHIAAFLGVLDEIPDSTAELMGHSNVEALRDGVERGFSEIRNAEVHAAESIFRATLTIWYETYPPYQP